MHRRTAVSPKWRGPSVDGPRGVSGPGFIFIHRKNCAPGWLSRSAAQVRDEGLSFRRGMLGFTPLIQRKYRIDSRPSLSQSVVATSGVCPSLLERLPSSTDRKRPPSARPESPRRSGFHRGHWGRRRSLTAAQDGDRPARPPCGGDF